MEGNRDEAEKCVEIAREALNAGDREKAQRFLQKAEKLYPLPSARGEALGVPARPARSPAPPSPVWAPAGPRVSLTPPRDTGEEHPTHPRPARPSRAALAVGLGRAARGSPCASLPARCRLSADGRELPVPGSVFGNVWLPFYRENVQCPWEICLAPS